LLLSAGRARFSGAALVQRAGRQAAELGLRFRDATERAERARPGGDALLRQRAAREFPPMLFQHLERTGEATSVELRFGTRQDGHFLGQTVGWAAGRTRR